MNNEGSQELREDFMTQFSQFIQGSNQDEVDCEGLQTRVVQSREKRERVRAERKRKIIEAEVTSEQGL